MSDSWSFRTSAFLSRRKKRPAWQPSLPWQERHHVVPSKSNRALQKNQRWYFDRLSAVGWKKGEFNDLFSFKSDAADLLDHRENIRRIFVQFPQFVCSRSKQRSRSGWRNRAYCQADADGTAGKNFENPGALLEDEDDVDIQRQVDHSVPNALLDTTEVDPQAERPASRKSSLAVQHDRGCIRSSVNRACISDQAPKTEDLESALLGDGQSEESTKQLDQSETARRESEKRESAILWGLAKKQLENQADTVPQQFLAEWCRVKRTNLVSMWRIVDDDKNMTLQKREFMNGFKELGYPENLDDLWRALDKDHTGNISFLEFVPEHAMDLVRFKHWVEEEFGTIRKFFTHLDVDKNGKLTRDEFLGACNHEGLPARLQKSIRTLFLLCDDPRDVSSKGQITEKELQFLEVWKCPTYLREKPDMTARMQFQDALLRLHDGNPLIAWRVALDPDQSMRVNYTEFEGVCKKLTRAGLAEADPKRGIGALYCALDLNRSGWFSLRDWDKETHSRLHEFYKFCKEKHLKVSSFVRSLEDRPGSGIGLGKFSKGIEELDIDADLTVTLFDGLSVGKGKKRNIMGTKPDKKVYAQDVLFLDKWRPEEEMRADVAWERKMVKRMGTYLKETGSLNACNSFGHESNSPRKRRGNAGSDSP